MPVPDDRRDHLSCIVGPKTLATATVDRLHHAHVVLTDGSSHRLAEATAGKGVMPLT